MIELIIIPLLVGASAQIIKLSIDNIPNNLTWQHFFNDYGGWPSSHAAFVASLMTALILKDGVNSPALAVAFILLLVVIRDAMGFRREIGKNAVLTNAIAREIFKGKNQPKLLTERIGHNFSEVLAGLILGVALTIFLYWLMLIL